MHTFKDDTGREWKVELNFTAAKRVKEVGSIDLLNGESLKRVGDLLNVVNAIYAICKPAADELGISDEAFGDLLVPCFDEAVNAFFAELEDFFHRLGRTALSSLLKKIRTWSRKEDAKKAELIEESEEMIESLLDSEMTKAKTRLRDEISKAMDGATAGGSPAS